MAEEKKKKSIKETLAELRSMGTSSEGFKKQAEQSKQESLAASKNKKLAESAKKQLQINKAKEEDDRASTAMKESRKTIEALSNRSTLRNYGGSSGPAETEGNVTNPAKSAGKPKPAAKPAPAAKAQPGPVKSTAPAKPAKETTPKVRVPSLFDRRKMTPATSELFIGDKAAQEMKSKAKTKPKGRRDQGGRR